MVLRNQSGENFNSVSSKQLAKQAKSTRFRTIIGSLKKLLNDKVDSLLTIADRQGFLK